FRMALRHLGRIHHHVEDVRRRTTIEYVPEWRADVALIELVARHALQVEQRFAFRCECSIRLAELHRSLYGTDPVLQLERAQSTIVCRCIGSRLRCVVRSATAAEQCGEGDEYQQVRTAIHVDP